MVEMTKDTAETDSPYPFPQNPTGDVANMVGLRANILPIEHSQLGQEEYRLVLII